MATPKRKIVKVFGIAERTRRGIIQYADLECGHTDKCNASERKQGWLYCFDCFYGKAPKAQHEYRCFS